MPVLLFPGSKVDVFFFFNLFVALLESVCPSGHTLRWTRADTVPRLHRLSAPHNSGPWCEGLRAGGRAGGQAGAPGLDKVRAPSVSFLCIAFYVLSGKSLPTPGSWGNSIFFWKLYGPDSRLWFCDRPEWFLSVV